jgi:saccharopine dehydrogenase-like NADP-dependent oxidoreductase
VRVVALGATGWFGRAAAALLCASEEVSEFVIAGRNTALAESLAGELGSKAKVARINAFDEAALTALVRGADLLVNTSGPYFQTLLPALSAAVRAGVNYCDFSEDWQAMARALSFDEEAKAAGITAIVGIGDAPGLTNLMAMHAARQFDAAYEIEVGWLSDIEGMLGTAADNVALMRSAGRVNGCLQAIIHALSSPIRNLQAGEWVTLRPFAEQRRITLPGAAAVEFHAFGSAEPNTLPRALPGLHSATSWMCLLPRQVNDLLHSQADRIAAGEISDRMAAAEVFEQLADHPERWLNRPADMPYGAAFAICSGRRGGRALRYGCIPAWQYRPEILGRDLGTAAPLAAAALRLLRGEITQPGVMPPEACIDPLPFFREIADRWATVPNGGLLLQWWEPAESDVDIRWLANDAAAGNGAGGTEQARTPRRMTLWH